MKAKKVFSLFLALTLAFSLVPGMSITASAAYTPPSALSTLSGSTGLQVKELPNTAGQTLSSGIYYVKSNMTINSGGTAANNGLAVASGATVYLYIPKGVTLTVYGKDGAAKASAGGAATAPTLEVIEKDSYSYKDKSGTSTATGARVYKKTSTVAGSAGSTGGSAGYAAIFVPSDAKLAVFGEGTLEAIGGKGGAGASGGKGAMTAHGATTMRMYSTSKPGEGTYWITDASHSSTDGTSFSLTWVQKHPRFYSNKNMRLYGGAGGGGGAGAGGGGAAIGTNGTAGAAGTVGATPVVKESTNSTHTFYNYTTPDIAKAATASAAAASAAAGTIYIASTVNTSGSKAGAGGAAGSGSAATSTINSYTRSVFTGWESANSKGNTFFQIADGQKGGAGGAGGAGAVFGKGGQGGQGGTGGDGGLAANTATKPSAAPKSGANGAAGAKGSSTNQTLAAANMPYYTVTFSGVASNGTQKYYLAQGTKITAPANNTANFIGWKVTTGASAPLSTVFGDGSALLSGDTKIYKAGEAIVLGKGTMGNVTLSAVCKTPVAITITAPDATYDGTPYNSASVTAGQDYTVSNLVKSYVGVNGTIYDPTSTPPTDAGSYKLTVSVPDSDPTYTGSANKTFKINPKELTNDSISDIPAQNYTDSAVTPKLTVKDGSKELTEGVDYSVTYADNVDERDDAKAKVTFKGNYTGTAEKTFTIKRLPPAVGEGFTIDYLNETITVWDGYTVLKKDRTTELTTGDKIEPGQELYVKKGSSEATKNTLPARPDAPERPTKLSRTGTTIALQKVEGQEYRFKENTASDYGGWTTGAVFTDLAFKTKYNFQTYIKATDHSFKSLPSSATDIETYAKLGTWQVAKTADKKSSIVITFADGYSRDTNWEHDEQTDNQVAYILSDEMGVDIDVYFWDNSAKKQSLIAAAQADADKKGVANDNVTTGFSNGIPYACYTAVEESEGAQYQTQNYIFPDANGNNYVEIVFWMSDATGNVEADNDVVRDILDRISTTTKYAVTITAQGADVTYGESYNVTVTEAELADYGIAVTPSYTYTYKQGDQPLSAKPVNAGEYTAVVAVDSNDPIYDTAKTADNGVAAIKINPKELKASNIEAIAPVIYNGSAHTPAVTVKDGSKTLVLGTDYTVAYTSNTNAGTATVTVTGMGNYTGTPTKSFAITPKGTLTVAAIQPTTLSDVTFTGSAMTPEETITVKDGDKTLTAGTDYDISYTDNTHAGVATMVVTLKGNYSGTLTKPFTIAPKTLTPDMVTVTLADNHYTGETLTPAVEVKCGSTVLIPGTDYTFESDSQNSGINAGTYTVKLTGTGDYQGTIEKTWIIEKADQAAPEEGDGFSVGYLTDEKITVADGYEVFIEKNGENVAVNTGDLAIPGETYYVCKAGSGNYNPSPLTANELPQRPDTPDAPELDYRNGVSIILAAKTGVCYKMDSGAWQGDGSFTVTGTAKHSFTAYIPATETTFKSETSAASAYSACGKLDATGTIVLNNGTDKTLSIKAPNYFIGENGQEDTFDDSQTGYYFIGENKTEFNAKVDFDTYWWDNTEDEYTLAEAIAEEMAANDMEGEATFETINNIPVAWYEMTETFGGESYTTRTYIIADSNKEFVEIVFWKSGADANAQIAAIINTLSTTRTFTVSYDDEALSDPVPYNSRLTKPSTDPTKDGHVFLGWYADEDCTQAWNFEYDTVLQDLNLHSGWAKDTDPVSSISGKVTMDNAPVAGAVVELWRGVDKVAATVTDANGNYTFNHVEDGIYDVVAAKDFGGDVKTKTKMVTVPDHTPGAGDIQLPSKSVNSILEHIKDELPENAKGDILHITAAGIDDIAEAKTPSSGEHFTIKLTVTPGASDASERDAIQSLAAGKNVEYLELTLTETYVNDADETLNRTDEDIGDSNTQLLTVCVPFDFSGVNVSSVMILRYHDENNNGQVDAGEAMALTELKDGDDVTEGSFRVDTKTGTITIYASKFSTYAVAYSYVSSGRSNTITVPVTGDENTVKVQASVSGSTATVKDIKDADLEKVSGGETVEIDLSGLNKTIDTAKIPTTTVEKIAEQGGMSVKLSTATVTFDSKATETISEQAKGNTIELVVDDIKAVSLNAVQKEAVQKLDAALIIDAYLVSNGTRLCSESKGGFGGGKATVALPYEIKGNRTAANYSVYYVDDAGKLEKLNASYDAATKAFVFDIEHFSNYVVAYDENAMLFVDVAEGSFYYDAVLWAATNGITSGTDATHFSPNMGTTRAQIVTFLWRAAGSPEPTGDASKFVDVKVGDYYEQAVAWGIETGVVKGTSPTTFSPDMICTRAHIAAFMARFAGVEDANCVTAFTDVPVDAYYASAVAWMLKNGITNGTSATTYSPDADCTRAQVVTFLYRLLAK